MSHHFKGRRDPFSRPAKFYRKLQKVALLAGEIRDQAMLDDLLAGADPLTRRALLGMLAPNLPFVSESTHGNQEEGE
jgi:hypothetical protein